MTFNNPSCPFFEGGGGGGGGGGQDEHSLSGRDATNGSAGRDK